MNSVLIFNLVVWLLMVPLLYGGNEAEGLRCMHCRYKKTDPHVATNTNDSSIVMDPSCARWKTPDPNLSADCSTLTPQLNQILTELKGNVFPDLPLEKLEMEEYLSSNNTAVEYYCFAVFVNESQIVLGKKVHLEYTIRSCVRCGATLTKILDELHRQPNGDNITGFVCNDDNCNHHNKAWVKVRLSNMWELFGQDE